MKKLTNTLGVLALALAAGVGCADKEDERDDTDPIERRADDPAREPAAADVRPTTPASTSAIAPTA